MERKSSSKWWPIPKGKAMSVYWTDGKLYYVVLGEDFLEDTCVHCKKLGNVKFGYKKQQGVHLFVCTNIKEIQPTILQPIEWNQRLGKGAECPFFERSE